jgi:hypothetical protein
MGTEVGRPDALSERCQWVPPYRVGLFHRCLRLQVTRGFARRISAVASWSTLHTAQAAKPGQSTRKPHKTKPSEAVHQTGIASPVRR